jgi:putative transposase
VARELVAIILRRERPDTIISDNGTEYTSNAIQADDTKVYWCRAPQKNGLNESFNDRPRDGLLNETLPIPPHARAVLED